MVELATATPGNGEYDPAKPGDPGQMLAAMRTRLLNSPYVCISREELDRIEELLCVTDDGT